MLEHFLKHGKTKEEEAKEVAIVKALAEKRLREVCSSKYLKMTLMRLSRVEM